MQIKITAQELHECIEAFGLQCLLENSILKECAREQDDSVDHGFIQDMNDANLTVVMKDGTTQLFKEIEEQYYWQEGDGKGLNGETGQKLRWQKILDKIDYAYLNVDLLERLGLDD